jgi:endogenous inhibitor of DNA gyrase (YacG/DUF329 family)
MRCPICKKPVPDPHRPTDARPGTKPAASTFPFCSDRCKLIDLGRWLDGKYQVPVVEEDGDETSLRVSADDAVED